LTFDHRLYLKNIAESVLQAAKGLTLRLHNQFAPIARVTQLDQITIDLTVMQ
jgi:hypothetical protein